MINHEAPHGGGPDATSWGQAPRETRAHLPVALIADHREWSARSLESILAPGGYAVVRAASGRQALEQASQSPPDLVFLVTDLPDIGGIPLCHRLRSECRVGESTPILLMLAAPVAREQRLAALRAGVWELVGLPLDAEELLLKLGGFLRAKIEANAARAESLLDERTGLYNLRGLLRRVGEMGAEAHRHHRPLACAVISLDVAAADAEGATPSWTDCMVRLLQSGTRGCDAVGRLGEQEFVVLAPNTDRQGVLQLTRRLAGAARTHTAGGRNGSAPPGLRVGCYAVADFAEANIEPVELLVRAAKALRSLRESASVEQIRFFELPVPAAGAGV